jgi:hypothetical protein
MFLLGLALCILAMDICWGLSLIQSPLQRYWAVVVVIIMALSITLAQKRLKP